jgi:hypothetical protein
MSQQSLDAIHPTVFIGLGGAGGQVLGRLNEIFRASYGRQVEEVGASPLQFLLLDTDDYEKLPLNVREGIPNPERDFISLSHFNPHRYATRQLEHADSDLHRWLDKSTLRFLDDAIIHDGASRLRTLGRLCLHYRYSDVEQRLREKMDEALSADIHAKAARIRPDARPLRIYIVSSSCGGTGSGSFVDVAAMANRVARDRGTTPDVQGFVFLPFPFIEVNARLDSALEAFYQQNAWAFFEELNYLLKHPRQIAEHVLDPGRKYGQPVRPFDYGKDLLRTIYLLGNRVSTLGTLELEQLYDYAAHGVFHVFLTPEEGTVQSRYSNIKVKLQETDRRFGLVKRFASFGYAEYRFAGHLKAHGIALRAADMDWEALVGIAPSAADVDAASAEVVAAIDSAVQSFESQVQGWTPPLPPPGSTVQNASDGASLQQRVLQLPQSVEASLAEKIRSTLSSGTVRSAVTKAVFGALDARRNTLPLGATGEIQVLSSVLQRLASRVAAATAAKPLPPLSTDAAILQSSSTLAKDALSIWRRRWGAGPLRRDEDAANAFVGRFSTFTTTLANAARERLSAELREQVSQALHDLTVVGGPLTQRVKEAENVLAVMSDRSTKARRVPGLPDAGESPTVQAIPSPGEVLAAIEDEAPAFHAPHAAQLKAGREAIWLRHRPELEQRQPGAALRLARALDQMWLGRAAESIPMPTPFEQLEAWADSIAAARGSSTSDDSDARNPLRRLVPLAMPPCPLDRTLLSQEDTVPAIVVAIGPESHRKQILAGLKVGDGAGWSSSPSGSRIAVLQTWYAFSSRALEGMETLRRSYLDRDRSLSLPHIERRWNEHGLHERVDATNHLTSDDVRLVARALALSHFFLRPGVNGSMAPGLYIGRDARDVEPPYLVRYHAADGTTELCWRNIRRVPDRKGRWEFTRDVHVHRFAAAHRKGDDRSPHGSSADPARDFSAYLGSEEREHHVAFLAEVEAAERSSRWRDEYMNAYRAYADEIDRRVAAYTDEGYERHLPFLRRIADELHRHIRELEPEASVLPDRDLQSVGPVFDAARVQPMEMPIP